MSGTAARLRSSAKRGICANSGSNREKTRNTYPIPLTHSPLSSYSFPHPSLDLLAQGHKGHGRPSARYPPWSVDDLRLSLASEKNSSEKLFPLEKMGKTSAADHATAADVVDAAVNDDDFGCRR